MQQNPSQGSVGGMENHKEETGDEWAADEMQVTVGGQKYWNWNVIDEKTRCILESQLSKRRDSRAVTQDGVNVGVDFVVNDAKTHARVVFCDLDVPIDGQDRQIGAVNLGRS